MRILLCTCLFFIFAACDDQNSNSSDRINYSRTGQQQETADTEFAAAFSIIQSRCINCHSGRHNAWAGFINDERWINSGLVHRGDPDNSSLITRIINSGHPVANMPEGTGAIPNAEFQTLRSWIAGMP